MFFQEHTDLLSTLLFADTKVDKESDDSETWNAESWHLVSKYEMKQFSQQIIFTKWTLCELVHYSRDQILEFITKLSWRAGNQVTDNWLTSPSMKLATLYVRYFVFSLKPVMNILTLNSAGNHSVWFTSELSTKWSWNARTSLCVQCTHCSVYLQSSLGITWHYARVRSLMKLSVELRAKCILIHHSTNLQFLRYAIKNLWFLHLDKCGHCFVILHYSKLKK